MGRHVMSKRKRHSFVKIRRPCQQEITNPISTIHKCTFWLITHTSMISTAIPPHKPIHHARLLIPRTKTSPIHIYTPTHFHRHSRVCPQGAASHQRIGVLREMPQCTLIELPSLALVTCTLHGHASLDCVFGWKWVRGCVGEGVCGCCKLHVGDEVVRVYVCV